MRALFTRRGLMAKTPEDICNVALDLLGEKSGVSNIETPETDVEHLCARHYVNVLEYLLRNYVWNFAKARKIISRDALNTPEFDYSDAYRLPQDFVRLVNFNEYKSLIDVDFDLDGTHLLLNNGGNADVRLRYIKRVDDVTKFDAGFVHLFSLYLAVNMAYKKTSKQTVIERLVKLIEIAEAKIVSIDGQERPPERIQVSKYGRARRGARSANSGSKYLIFKD